MISPFNRSLHQGKSCEPPSPASHRKFLHGLLSLATSLSTPTLYHSICQDPSILLFISPITSTSLHRWKHSLHLVPPSVLLYSVSTSDVGVTAHRNSFIPFLHLSTSPISGFLHHLHLSFTSLYHGHLSISSYPTVLHL